MSHAAADWDRWRERREAVGAGVSETVEGRYAVAVHRVAEVPGGTTRLTGRLADLDAGAPARGDDRAVIEAAVAGAVAAEAAATARAREESEARAAKEEARRATFTRAVEAGEAWEQAMRADTARRRNSRTGPVEETPFARALRTDEPLCDGAVLPEPDETVAYGAVVIPALQKSLIDDCATGPVEVTVHKDLPNHHGGWSEYDAATGRTRVLKDDVRGWADERVHGTVVVVDKATGERRGLRAIQDASTGAWEIQGPQYREGSR